MTDRGGEWRESVSDAIEIGRALNEIESAMNHVRAVNAVPNDESVRVYIGSAIRASRRLTRALEALDCTARQAPRLPTKE